MKKLFITLCILALCVSISGAGVTQDKLKVIARKNAGVSGCVGTLGSLDETSEGAATAIIASAFTFSGADCKVNTIKFKNGDDSGYDIKLGIYSNNTGAPQTLLAQLTTPIASVGNHALVSGTLDSEVTLVNGTTYWLGFIGDASVNYHWVSGGDSSLDGTHNYAASMPATWTDDEQDTRSVAVQVSWE